MAIRRVSAHPKRRHMSLEVWQREAERADRARAIGAFPPVAADATRVRRLPRRRRAGGGGTGGDEPDTIDLLRDQQGRRVGPAVHDQGDAESCTAHAITAAMEVMIFKRNPVSDVLQLSAQHAFRVAQETEELSVAVGVAAVGVLEDECFDAGTLCADHAAHTWRGRFSLLRESPAKQVAAMRSCLRQGLPLVAAINIPAEFEDYSGGVFASDKSIVAAHAVVVVGYEKHSPVKGLWISKNSYGSNWGGDNRGFLLTEWNDGFLQLERVVYVLEDVHGPG